MPGVHLHSARRRVSRCRYPELLILVFVFFSLPGDAIFWDLTLKEELIM